MEGAVTDSQRPSAEKYPLYESNDGVHRFVKCKVAMVVWVKVRTTRPGAK